MGLVRFSVKTGKKTEFIDIGGEVARIVAAAGVEEGICQVSVPHTTAAVTVNENADPSVVRDMLMELNKVNTTPMLKETSCWLRMIRLKVICPGLLRASGQTYRGVMYIEL